MEDSVLFALKLGVLLEKEANFAKAITSYKRIKKLAKLTNN